MAFWQWAELAASNATADPTINWAEGQAPSTINDSARSMMTRLAEWRTDISGKLVTTGTSTAYVVFTHQTFDTLAHMDGAMICFVPHTTSGATVTLNVDGLGAKPLRSAPSVELQAGVLVQGVPYVITYNNSDIAFYLQNFLGPATNSITNSLSGDVALNNTANFFDGPSVAQGTSGTWFVSGTVTLNDTGGLAAAFFAKLWDGTTVIAATATSQSAASINTPIALSGILAAPAGNLRISVRDLTSTNGVIRFNQTGLSKDSTITAVRIK